MSVSQLYYGNAYAEYATGEPVNWQRGMDLVRRPEDDGADVRRFGKRPVRWTMMAVLFADTMSSILNALRAWEAEVSAVQTLFISRSASYNLAGVTLHSVYPVGQIRGIKTATNAADYMLTINLVFSRVNET